MGTKMKMGMAKSDEIVFVFSSRMATEQMKGCKRRGVRVCEGGWEKKGEHGVYQGVPVHHVLHRGDVASADVPEEVSRTPAIDKGPGVCCLTLLGRGLDRIRCVCH